MSECITHKWFPKHAHAKIHPTCPWCQISDLRKQVSELKTAAKDVLALCEPIETSNAYCRYKALKESVYGDKHGKQ